MLSEVLPFMRAPTSRTRAPAKKGSTSLCQKHELLAWRESVEKTLLLYSGRSVSFSELSMASQVNERHLRRILEQLKTECRITFKGCSVIHVPPQEPSRRQKGR